MRIVKRKIFVKGVEYTIWLGLKAKEEARRTIYELFFYPDDPNTGNSKPTLIKKGFNSDKVALDHGKEFMKDLYTRMLNK